jgi:hypothetical protein
MRATGSDRPLTDELNRSVVGWSLITLGSDQLLCIPLRDGAGGFAEPPDDESFLTTFWASSYCARHRSPWPKEIAALDHHMLVAARTS